jgi:predicted cation transporter
MVGWPRSALLLLAVVIANIVAAGTPIVLVVDVLLGLYAMRRGTDYATRWQPLVLAVLLAGLDLVGRESDPFIQSLAAHLPESAPTVLLACVLWYATAFTSHFADNALASRIFIGVAFTIGSHDGRSPEEADLLAASVVLGAMWGGFALIPANLPNFRLAKVFEVSPGEWGRAAVSRLYLSTGWIQPLWIVALFLFWKHF